MTRPARAAGFTLIELSIVLVIIGLVVGGVQIGRDMIGAARSRHILSATEQFTQGVMVFKAKYGCLPGDCPNATAFFANTGNGNGDGAISSSFDGPSCTGTTVICVNARDDSAIPGLKEEVTLLNEHLAKARLISLASFNSRTDPIPSKLAGTWFLNLGTGINLVAVTPPTGRNTIHLAADDYAGWSGLLWFDGVPSLTARQAYYIDNKIDDGLPLSGKVVHERWAGFVTNLDIYGCLNVYGGSLYDVAGTNVAPLSPVAKNAPCMLSFLDRF